MKLLIISAGPGLDQIRTEYGHATDWISNLINSSNTKIDINNIYDNEDFDESYYDAWIITGSASSVVDNLDWMKLLKNKIIYAYDNSIPVLGICFGHQIISSALGGEVVHNDKGWELGSYKLELTQEGFSNALFNDIHPDDYFYFSHEDIVSKLPKNAIRLASNAMGLQSFSVGNQIFGVQFHPEFTFDIMDQYVKVRYEKGIISQYNPVIDSKSSYKIIPNFIKIVKEKIL
jgi:GMP synthase (glutamine-hydrolysing)